MTKKKKTYSTIDLNLQEALAIEQPPAEIRRPLIPQPLGRYMAKNKYQPGDLVIRFASQGDKRTHPAFIFYKTRGEHRFTEMQCPWGEPEKIIACREPWAATKPDVITYEAGGESKISGAGRTELLSAYRIQPPDAWRGPETLPDNLIRTFMEIESIVCQKLWAITEEAAAKLHGLKDIALRQPPSNARRPYRQLFAQHWDTRNHLAEHRWNENPWIWVIRLVIPTNKNMTKKIAIATQERLEGTFPSRGPK